MANENKIIIAGAVCVVVVIACGIFFLGTGEEKMKQDFRDGRFHEMMYLTEEEMTNMRPPDGNFTPGMMPPEGTNFNDIEIDEESMNEVSVIFESTDRERITEYCEEHLMECGYYCRTIEPENEFCTEIRPTRR